MRRSVPSHTNRALHCVIRKCPFRCSYQKVRTFVVPGMLSRNKIVCNCFLQKFQLIHHYSPISSCTAFETYLDKTGGGVVVVVAAVVVVAVAVVVVVVVVVVGAAAAAAVVVKR